MYTDFFLPDGQRRQQAGRNQVLIKAPVEPRDTKPTMPGVGGKVTVTAPFISYAHFHPSFSSVDRALRFSLTFVGRFRIGGVSWVQKRSSRSTLARFRTLPTSRVHWSGWPHLPLKLFARDRSTQPSTREDVVAANSVESALSHFRTSQRSRGYPTRGRGPQVSSSSGRTGFSQSCQWRT